MQNNSLDDNVALMPTTLDPPRDLPAPTPSPRATSHWLASGVLALLTVTAIAVFTWLPKAVTPSAEIAMPPMATVTPPPSPAADSPLLVPEPPGAREDAQSSLAATLEALDMLRATGVETWDAPALKQIEAAIADGEQAYREQRFTKAIQHYSQATTAIEAATARIPEVVADYLDEGERALLSHDARAALFAFTQALRLAPDNAAAQRGVKRADAFEQVLALLNEAQGYERLHDNEKAIATYRAALKLDPDAREASLALARLASAQTDAAFTAAMSKGFSALEKNDFAPAISAFEQAVKLRPQASAAVNALSQAKARAAAAAIERALTNAQRAEQTEAWAEAARQYRAALQVDPALAHATQGAARATRLAELAGKLDAALAAPARLREDSTAREVDALLTRVRAEDPAPPKLAATAARLQESLTIARTPLRLTLRSDGLTQVKILKVGSFQPFTEQQLELLPGRYTALGSRAGYRDTRLEFELNAESNRVIAIQCDEALPFRR